MLKKWLKSALKAGLYTALKNNRLRRRLEYVADNAYYDHSTSYPYRGYEAMQYLLKNYEFSSVLDVGCGEGMHSDVFLKAGKNVTAIDYGKSPRLAQMNPDFASKVIVDNFMKHDFGGRTFDCVWCSHVLEHQLNTQDCVKKLVSLTKMGGGVLVITVPPYKPMIVGGHVSLWNAGLLLYRLVLAGMDCRNAHVKTYDYDVSVIVERKNVIDVSDKLFYDMGDLRTIKEYLPSGLDFSSNEHDDPFYGNIRELNW